MDSFWQLSETSGLYSRIMFENIPKKKKKPEENRLY
jgi:hypothetical protein